MCSIIFYTHSLIFRLTGGCGAMYEVWVEAPDFKGLSRVKQHKLITQVKT